LSACEQYPPEQLQFTLLDFKKGVSFWEYEGLAHVANLYAPLKPDFNWAIACIEQFEAKLEQHNQLFRNFRGVQTLADYNRCAEKKLPRHILLIDEAQDLFEKTDFQRKNRVKALLSIAAKKGAAAGLHIILSTQSYQNFELDSDVKEQFHLRIGFKQATSTACYALMGRDNAGMLNLPRFHAVYNAHFGEETFNRTVALHHLKDFSQRLDALKAAYPSVVNVTPPPSENKPAPPVDGNVTDSWF
jgi:S-DNA-T family DNA segregation ATPase FtsK/SpoIIIE